MWLPLIFEAHIFFPRETHLQRNDGRKWKRRKRFIGIHFMGMALGTQLVSKQGFSEDDPGTNCTRVTWKVMKTLTRHSLVPRRTYHVGISGDAVGKCVFLTSPIEIFMCIVRHTEGHHPQKIQVAGNHALSLLLDCLAAGSQVWDGLYNSHPFRKRLQSTLQPGSSVEPPNSQGIGQPSLLCAKVVGVLEQSKQVLGGGICQEEQVIGLIYDTQHGTWLLSSITVAPHGGVHAL